jgi:hypothetical protein
MEIDDEIPLTGGSSGISSVSVLLGIGLDGARGVLIPRLSNNEESRWKENDR